MAGTVLKTIIQVRRDTTANWEANKDVVPAAGEPCLDLDTGAVKYGDGVTAYENLKSAGSQATHAENVDGLAGWITARAATLEGLSENSLTDERAAKLDSVAENANQNVIETVKIGGVAASVNDEDKSVDVPIATAAAPGAVKGSAAENGVSIAADGTMSVNSISMSKITQADEDTLILDGGNSAQ